jgi:branched-chain amino acid transport system substrate-binding protein
MKKLLSVVMAFFLIQAAWAGAKQDAPSAGKVIKLGGLAPITGTNAEFGRDFRVGWQMAVDKINAAGGINGNKLELVIRDSKGDPRESSDLARQFADDEEIYAILGDFTSGACMANAPIVDEAGIVQLSPTASNPDYAPLSPYCFTISGRMDVEGPFYAKYLLQKYMGLTTVGVMYVNSDWGNSAFSNFKAEADKIGLKVPVAVNYVADEKDFSSLITRIRSTPGVEAVCIMDQGAVPQIINQIRAAGWDIPLTTSGGNLNLQILNLCGKNAEGLILTSSFMLDENNPEHAAWKKEYMSYTNTEPSSFPCAAYDTVRCIAEAIRMCGNNVTRKAIRDNLARVSINGLIGPIKFNAAGDINRHIMICGVENGRYVIKKGYDYSME